MNITTIRHTTCSVNMTINKGMIILTDMYNDTIKYSIDINKSEIYSHRTKTPTLLHSGIRVTRISYDTNNIFLTFMADILTHNHSTLYYMKVFDNLSFIESAIKIYGIHMVTAIDNKIRHTLYNNILCEPQMKKQILKDRNYVQWCFTNKISPMFEDSYTIYASHIVIKELCGEDTELYENTYKYIAKEFKEIKLNDSASWKSARMAIKIIQENPMLIYKYTNSDLTINYSSMIRNIKCYFEKCDEMDREPSVKDYVYEELRTQVMYYNWCKQKEAERFQSRYSDILKFEQGGLEVVLPTHPTDLTKEGNENHNCVGGYINSVIGGRCIIVFVRKKDNPTKSYITCEIRQNGKIGQFYLRSNYDVTEQADKDFEKAYSQYLQDHWDEIQTQLLK